ncbi:MAG: flavodoxin family protein [Patescibacteria group bacterium]
MKITTFDGSLRTNRSKTYALVKKFAAGASEAGATIETIFLVKKNIQPCKGCFACWFETPGKCKQKDGTDKLVRTFLDSDVVVFSTPLHSYNVSVPMKIFIDRLLLLTSQPRLEKRNGNDCFLRPRYRKCPRIVVLASAGFAFQKNFSVLDALFERITQGLRTKVIGKIYCSETEIFRDNARAADLLDRYGDLVKQAGREIVKNRCLSPQTSRGLKKGFLPGQEYIKLVNQAWKKILRGKPPK